MAELAATLAGAAMVEATRAATQEAVRAVLSEVSRHRGGLAGYSRPSS